MTDTIHTWLDERETIHGKATKGPWKHVDKPFRGDVGHNVSSPERVVVFGGFDSATPEAEADAISIADAHNTLPKLLAGVRAVLELHRRVPVLTKVLDDGCHDIEFHGVEDLGAEYMCSHPSHVEEWTCRECSELGQDNPDGEFPEWPCATVQKLQESINDDE